MQARYSSSPTFTSVLGGSFPVDLYLFLFLFLFPYGYLHLFTLALALRPLTNYIPPKTQTMAAHFTHHGKAPTAPPYPPPPPCAAFSQSTHHGSLSFFFLSLCPVDLHVSRMQEIRTDLVKAGISSKLLSSLLPFLVPSLSLHFEARATWRQAANL